jgi:hypothetical protein
MCGIAGFCPRAASGQKIEGETATPPRSVMNRRRFIAWPLIQSARIISRHENAAAPAIIKASRSSFESCPPMAHRLPMQASGDLGKSPLFQAADGTSTHAV